MSDDDADDFRGGGGGTGIESNNEVLVEVEDDCESCAEDSSDTGTGAVIDSEDVEGIGSNF